MVISYLFAYVRSIARRMKVHILRDPHALALSLFAVTCTKVCSRLIRLLHIHNTLKAQGKYILAETSP